MEAAVGDKMEQKKIVAIILAAGSGKRMQSDIPKQYLHLNGKPILYYSLKTFDESIIDEIVLVVGKNEIDYCKKEIIDKYKLKKVQYVIEGGEQRYHSVFNGLSAINYADYVLIHDGARPFVTKDIINRTIDEVYLSHACAVGVPSKDTIKIVDDKNYVVVTPNRDRVWSIQTPQGFSYELIVEAYKKIINSIPVNITDDAMIIEYAMDRPIKIVKGSYTNIKITTPEDIIVGEAFIKMLENF